MKKGTKKTALMRPAVIESAQQIWLAGLGAFAMAGEEGKDLFALEVQGDSMIDAMINDGDIVILKPAQDARNGDMVAIWLSDKNETTLKYFYKEKDGYRLQPANPTMKPILVKKTESLEIKGKVVMVIRKVDRYI